MSTTLTTPWARHQLHQHYVELRDAVYAARDRYNANPANANADSQDALDAIDAALQKRLAELKRFVSIGRSRRGGLAAAEAQAFGK